MGVLHICCSFFPGYILGETGTHLFSFFYLFLRTNNNSAGWWHEKPEKIFFGIFPRRCGPPAVGQAVVGEEWEVGEKPSTFLGSHEGGVGQENTYKGWNNMWQTTLHPDSDDRWLWAWRQMIANIRKQNGTDRLREQPRPCSDHSSPQKGTQPLAFPT